MGAESEHDQHRRCGTETDPQSRMPAERRPHQLAADASPICRIRKGNCLTAKGKAKHRQAGTSHLASRKRKKNRRNLRGTKVLDKSVLHQITRALAGHSL